MSDQERYRWIEFHKWQFKAQWFQALSGNSNLVLMLKAEMGYLGSYNKHKVSPFNRYEVGGDGMSGYNIYGIDIISMRGYEDGALDPSSYYSRGYNKYTAELRYPVILEAFVADLRAGLPRGAVTRSTRGRVSRRSRSSVRPVSACGSTCRWWVCSASTGVTDSIPPPIRPRRAAVSSTLSWASSSKICGVAINLEEKSYIYGTVPENPVPGND